MCVAKIIHFIVLYNFLYKKITMKEKRITIEMDGTEYPCAVSMGAFQDYYEATGKEAHEGMTIRESGVWLWACVKSACERDNVEFNLSTKQFMNRTTPQILADWAAASFPKEAAEPKETKKKRKG